MYYMNDGVYGSFASKLSEDLNTIPEVHKASFITNTRAAYLAVYKLSPFFFFLKMHPKFWRYTLGWEMLPFFEELPSLDGVKKEHQCPWLQACLS